MSSSSSFNNLAPAELAFYRSLSDEQRSRLASVEQLRSWLAEFSAAQAQGAQQQQPPPFPMAGQQQDEQPGPVDELPNTISPTPTHIHPPAPVPTPAEIHLQALNERINTLQATIARLANPPVREAAPTPPPKIRVNKPKEFHGARNKVNTYLAQCALVFLAEPAAFKDEQIKILYMASFLRGDAFSWYEAVVNQSGAEFTTFEEFKHYFKSTFGEDASVHQDKAFALLRSLRQTHSCQAYATKFTQVGAKVRIDTNAKMHLFKEGLKPAVKLHLIGLDPAPKTLQDLILKAVHYDDLYHNLGPATFGNAGPLRNNRRTYNNNNNNYGNPGSGASGHSGSSSSASTPNTTSDAVPMDIDAVNVKQQSPREKLSQAEKQRRKEQGLCIYCGGTNCGGAQDVNKCNLLVKKNSGKGGGSEKT